MQSFWSRVTSAVGIFAPGTALLIRTRTFCSPLPLLPVSTVSSSNSVLAQIGSDLRLSLVALGGVPVKPTVPEMVPPPNETPETNRLAAARKQLILRIFILAPLKSPLREAGVMRQRLHAFRDRNRRQMLLNEPHQGDSVEKLERCSLSGGSGFR